MKIDAFVKNLDGCFRVITFLDADKSGEIYTLNELSSKIPGLPTTSRLRPTSNPAILKYTLTTKTKTGRKVFYGNPAVIERAKEYATVE